VPEGSQQPGRLSPTLFSQRSAGTPERKGPPVQRVSLFTAVIRNKRERRSTCGKMTDVVCFLA